MLNPMILKIERGGEGYPFSGLSAPATTLRSLRRKIYSEQKPTTLTSEQAQKKTPGYFSETSLSTSSE